MEIANVIVPSVARADAVISRGGVGELHVSDEPVRVAHMRKIQGADGVR